MQAVTFDPVVYDEHPSTLRLVTYGGELLAALLASVAPPDEVTQGGQLARCSATAPVERVGWYAVDGELVTPIRRLSHLHGALRSFGKVMSVAETVVAAARRRFDQEMAPICEQEANTVRMQERSRAEALAEEIRDLLLQAAYVELAKSAADGIFGTERGVGFSVESVRRLRRHKFPFAGALKAVAVDRLTLSATDPKYEKLSQSRGDQLDRRFEAIKNRLAELLPQYVEVVGTEGRATPKIPAEQDFQVVGYWAR
jgi:hypothetical protein